MKRVINSSSELESNIIKGIFDRVDDLTNLLKWGTLSKDEYVESLGTIAIYVENKKREAIRKHVYGE